MKPLSIVALIFVIILGALFIYVAEDLPTFGDANSPANRFVKLFSIDADEIEGDLNQGNISASLMAKIEARGLPRPSRVEEVEEGWDMMIEKEERHYPNEERYYFVKEEGDTLWVYRYAPIIRYIEKGYEETEVLNMVTFVLADYRGFDTLGEVTVIFTAGISVLLLLRRRKTEIE
jgi:multicomponent Na+:H+ antiporter subunit B